MKTTEIVMILDASGSMYDLTEDTIGGFNSFIEEQKANNESGNQVLVSAVKFSDSSKVMYDRVPIEKIEKMTKRQYRTGGCTALLDAMGDAIKHIGNVHKYARPEDVPETTIFVIITDGYENASHKYSSDAIKKIVKKQEKNHGWQFLFLGANIDAVETGADFGFSEENSINYIADEKGTDVVFKSINIAVGSARACGSVCADWADEVNEDYKSRK
ncbi:MAG: VWA domain-containing protein [Clostridia bacterium]|nr:VWA domain-containing protein [Clostridia bacterium]MBQ1896025.1 VWA domain-containing protein [Clostridia bacterium]